MYKRLFTLMIVMTSASMAMAQNAAPAAGANGMMAGNMMDPAARFKQLDKNNDGNLSAEEYAAMQQMMRPGGTQGGQGGPQGGAQSGPPAAGGQQGTPPASASGMGGNMMNSAERFKQMDKNSDGKVTAAEFTAAMQQMRGPQGGAPAAGQGGK